MANSIEDPESAQMAGKLDGDEVLSVLKGIHALMKNVDGQLKDHGARLANIEKQALKDQTSTGKILVWRTNGCADVKAATIEASAAILAETIRKDEKVKSPERPLDWWRKDLKILPYDTSSVNLKINEPIPTTEFLTRNFNNAWAIPSDGRVEIGFTRWNLTRGVNLEDIIEKFRELEEDLRQSSGEFWVEDHLMDPSRAWIPQEKYTPYSIKRQELPNPKEHFKPISVIQKAEPAVTHNFLIQIDAVVAKLTKVHFGGDHRRMRRALHRPLKIAPWRRRM